MNDINVAKRLIKIDYKLIRTSKVSTINHCLDYKHYGAIEKTSMKR